VEPILAALEVESFGKPVRVEFTKTGDVISHTIFLVDGSEKVSVLTSRINAPGLPCFTELHQQEDLLFLTGADGPCHWSMSVQARHDSERSEIVFDVACRNKEPALVLSTVYSGSAWSGLSVDPVGEDTRIEMERDSSVRIACRHAAPNTVPATLRWSYAVGRMV
jgi:hypothetical protein